MSSRALTQTADLSELAIGLIYTVQLRCRHAVAKQTRDDNEDGEQQLSNKNIESLRPIEIDMWRGIHTCGLRAKCKNEYREVLMGVLAAGIVYIRPGRISIRMSKAGLYEPKYSQVLWLSV